MRRLVLTGLLAPSGLLFAAKARSDEEAQKDSRAEAEMQNASDLRPGLTAALNAEPRFLNVRCRIETASTPSARSCLARPSVRLQLNLAL